MAESQACNSSFSHLHVNHPLAQIIFDELHSEPIRHVILTGHAGDGKSTLAIDVLKMIKGINISEPLTPHGARDKFNYILKQAGIFLPCRKRKQRGPCLHCLRHVFVFKAFSNSEKNGQRIDDIIPYLSIYLGHDSLRETEKYLKFSSELFPDEMKLFEQYTTQVFP